MADTPKTTHLDQDERQAIPVLLRYREADLDKKTNNKRSEGISSLEKLKQYLIKEYGFTQDGLGDLRKKTDGSLENGLIRNKEPEIWRKFIPAEREKIANEINEGRYSKLYYPSTDGFIRAGEIALQCIFFNTYIPMSGWSNPIIQMHLGLQKRIELGNLYTYIHTCHSSDEDTPDRDQSISNCHGNPPAITQYRINFIPLTNFEFHKKINSDKSYAENLKFTTFLHHTAGIQLGLLTVNNFRTIINNHKEFFANTENLTALGIDHELAMYLGDELKKSQIESILKRAIERMRMPKEESYNGLDYMYARPKLAAVGNDNKIIWGAYYDEENGLTYFPTTEPSIVQVKEKFAQLMFQTMSVTRPIPDNDFNFLAPIHRFFENETNKSYTLFSEDYNSLDLISNLLK
jgi:hypothetical protein